MDIDERLKKWGQHQDATVRHDNDTAVQTCMAQIRALPKAEGVPHNLRLQLVWMRVAVAASLCIIAVLAAVLIRLTDRHHTLLSQNVTVSSHTGTMVHRGMHSDDLQEVRVFVAEVDYLFPEGLRWVSRINGELSMETGMGLRVAVGDMPEPRVLIRYTVQAMQENGQWEPVGQHDVVTYADEPVVIGDRDTHQLWCHVTSDRRAAVSASLSLNTRHGVLALSAENLQTIGTTEIVQHDELNGQRYRVAQSVFSI